MIDLHLGKGPSRSVASSLVTILGAVLLAPLEMNAQGIATEVFRAGEEMSGLPFGDVSDVVHDPSTGRVFVADAMARSITALDEDGEVLFSFGRQGSGPGEFSTGLTGLALFDDHLVVSDQTYLHRFNLDGEYVDRIEFRPENPVSAIISVDAGPGFLLVGTREVVRPEQVWGLYRVDDSQVTRLEFLPFRPTPDLTRGERHHWAVAGPTVLISRPGTTFVRRWNASHQREDTVTVSPGRRSFERDDVQALADRLDEQCRASSMGARCRSAADEYLEAFRAKRGPIPPVGTLVGNREGGWLIGRADGPGDLFGGTYVELETLDETGRSEGWASLPRPMEPMSYSAGVVWGVVFGEYDEPMVIGYRLPEH